MTSAEIAALPIEARESMKVREQLKGKGEVDILTYWYKGEKQFELTQKEDDMRRRWDRAKAQFLGMSTYAETLESLMTEFGISISQARNDIRNMRHAFGNLDEVPKALHRERAIHMSLAAYKLAEKNQDPDGMAKATKVYIMASGVDKEDVDTINLEKLMNERIYVDALDPMVRNFMLNFIQQSGGVTDATKMFEAIYAAKDDSNFVDYEQVNDEADAPE
jgi:hypothetical protein